MEFLYNRVTLQEKTNSRGVPREQVATAHGTHD